MATPSERARLVEAGRGLRHPRPQGQPRPRRCGRSWRRPGGRRGPVLIEFQVETEENVYPMVRPGRSLGEVMVG